MPLYASVYMSLVVTCWEMADLLTLSLLLSHWYPGSGVVLDCIDSDLAPLLTFSSRGLYTGNWAASYIHILS